MPVVGLGARPKVQAGEKGGIRGTKTEDTNGMGNALARERDHRRRIGQRSKSPSKNIMTEGIRN